jgi:hypothetical protein
MTRRTISGICQLCEKRVSKGAMWRHLQQCAATHEGGSHGATRLVQLRVEGGGPWWLDIEARADASLDDLDRFLRAIWLECCGHLSAFYDRVGRSKYPKKASLEKIFGASGTTVRYEYDFGSTTELLLRSIGSRSGDLGKNRVRLLARNEPPLWTCARCGEPATQVCLFSYDEDRFLCDAHSDDHDCDETECHLPVVNSPRMGVCGYTGPLE